MKVNITRVIGGSNPEVTIFHYARARWNNRRKFVILSGIAKSGNKCWDIVHTYNILPWLRHLPKEEILYKLFNF